MMKDAMRRDMLDVVYVGLKETLDEYTLTKLDKMMGIKKGDRVFFVSGSNAEGNIYAQNEKEALEKAKKKGIRGKISVRDKGEYKGQPRLVNSVNEGKRISPKILNLMKVITAYKQAKPGSKERQNMLNFINKELKAMGKQPIKDDGVQTLRLGEGYESEVLKVLNKADIDGYFKMGKLYVSRRDAKDAKKALEDSDKMMGIKKGDRVFFVSGSNAEGNIYAQNEKEALEKAKKKGIRGKISVRDKGEYKGQPGS